MWVSFKSNKIGHGWQHALRTRDGVPHNPPLFVCRVHSPNHLIQQIHTHDPSGMALGLVQFVARDPRVIKAWGPLLNMRLKLD